LCGTGVVFDREIAGVATEFGVSGMLWQSNLLMYNRADQLAERNLWSQVLGEAVVGNKSGQKLKVIPSDIMRFGDWSDSHPGGQVLGGVPSDPYAGRYYEVARQFAPNFNESDSTLLPDEYVYGIEINQIAKAYPRELLPTGVTTDTVGGVTIIVTSDGGVVSFADSAGVIIPDTEGFWFSWKATHPNTLIFDN